MKILQAADRAGWAIDRVSKPLSELYENVDVSYFHYKPARFLASGYSEQNEVIPYSADMANKYDVVHYHHPNCAKTEIGKLNKGIKKVLTVHNERMVNEDWEWKSFDDIVCPTKYCMQALKDKHPNLHLVPYGIDLKKYNYQFKDPLENTVGYVGRVMKHKRFGDVKKEIYKAGLKMIGTGYIQEPEEFKKHHEIERDKHFKFTILLPERQMNDFYAKMGIFVCLSEGQNETGPLPVLEALACGVPVISTKIGWAKDNCTHNSNIIFIDDDQIPQLHSILKGLNKNADLKNKLRSNGIRLMERFSMENYAKQLMKIYEKKFFKKKEKAGCACSSFFLYEHGLEDCDNYGEEL